MIGSRLAIAAILTVMHVTAAGAQQAVRAVPGRLELDAGIVWTGAQALGTRDATLTTGTGSTLHLFSSTSDLLAATGFEGRVAVKVARTLDAYASMSYAKPELTTRVTSDIENSTGATVSESVRQYLVGGGIVWYVAPRRVSSRIRPFIGAGAAYLRQLHEGATLVETGQSYDVGGGVKVLFAARTRPRQLVKATGVRLEARAIVRTKGITFDGRRSIAPAAAASFFVRF
jgi:hypothetical protein